jgi:hypothetical protein
LGLAKTILVISKSLMQDGFQTYSFLKASEYNYLADHYMVLEKLKKGINILIKESTRFTYSVIGMFKFKKKPQ